jgi:hypothetical protein
VWPYVEREPKEEDATSLRRPPPCRSLRCCVTATPQTT